MKLELSREEVAEMFQRHVDKIFGADAKFYEIEVEPEDKYSSNSGGLIIRLSKKANDEH